MARNVIRRLEVFGLAAGLVVWSTVPLGRRPLPRAAVATALAALTSAPLNLRPPRISAGLRLGSAAASVVVVGVAAATAVPSVRDAMARRPLPAGPAGWLLLRIPLGTVWPEELAYRGALATLAIDAFGWRAGNALQASAFGLSHVDDARGAGDPVVPTVLATGAAGWLFGWLAARSGSLAAPMLTHLAINEAGAVAALVVQRARS